MQYRQNGIPVALWAFLAFCFVIVVVFVSYASLESRKIRLEETRIQQEQETIRNEEDNQWWQKAIPWGEYEDEEER